MDDALLIAVQCGLPLWHPLRETRNDRCERGAPE